MGQLDGYVEWLGRCWWVGRPSDLERVSDTQLCFLYMVFSILGGKECLVRAQD
jgi:hypothetical protein